MNQTLYLRQLALGPMENFVYLIGAESSPEVAVVDPAWEVGAVEQAAAADGKRLSCAVLSHSHFDHTNGVPELLERHDVPVYAQKAEIDFSPELRALGDALRPVEPGQRIPVGPLELTMLHTPGHTPGSQCVLCGGALLSGDTVFVNACGRCDLKGGDPEQLHRSITEVLMKLPAETKLYPGHDYGDVPVSSIGRECERNPYFRQANVEAFLAFRSRPR
ncbi:MAG: MBL fold metallo-hydrolase [Myxococcales bacterium]|nr:MBL fold metallo-hydrolase [Myxococcales bacterium]